MSFFGSNSTHEKLSGLFELEEEVSIGRVNDPYIPKSRSICTKRVVARSHENDLTKSQGKAKINK